ncbi:MAG: right-handed parallel beta-helix repeat-containing protein [Thermoplasmata archaeon]|nr:right-handed parallel beta-helix repeat-containing protein [Thermoplasmata archaeon]
MREVGAALLCLMMLAGGLPTAGVQSIPMPSISNTIYMNGDWIVNDTQVRENETIVLTGNLTIQNGGDLTLKNVTMMMNSSATIEYRIEVLAGGRIGMFDSDGDNTTTSDASRTLRNNPNYGYFFQARDSSSIEIRNSEITTCGRNSGFWDKEGLYIATDDAVIDRCRLADNEHLPTTLGFGIILYGSDATVSNCTIEWNYCGIMSGYWSNGTIVDNLIKNNKAYGIHVDGGSSPPNDKDSNPYIARNKILNTGRNNYTAVPIQINEGSCPRITNNIIINYTEDAIYCGEQCQAIIENNYIDSQGGNYGIVGSSSRNVYVKNCTIVDNTVKEHFWAGTMWFHVINCTFNQSKIWLEGISIPPSIDVGWHLNLRVDDQVGNPVPGATVHITDNANGTYNKTFIADADGRVRSVELIEYNLTKNGTTRYTSHRLDVSCDGHFPSTLDVVMNESKSITITLEKIPVPAEANLTLSPGWNLISLPVLQPKLNGTAITCADDLATATGCTMLSKWNASGQAYINYIAGFNLPTDPENFAIGEDDGIFVWWDGSGAVTFNVTGYEPGPRSVHLQPGWNIVGYNRLTEGNAETDWAGQVSCGGLDDICWYDGKTFVHYIFPGTEMALLPTRGYFVWSDNETWLDY